MSIELSGGKIYLLNNPQSGVYVASGEVLVYILPVADSGEFGRRIKLFEANEGDKIPALIADEQKCKWRFGITAVDQASVTLFEPENWDVLRMNFAKAVGIRLFEAEEFEEQIINWYDLQKVKDEAYIYASAQNAQAVKRQSLELILNYFRKNSVKHDADNSSNRVYDMAALLCKAANIPLVPFEQVKACCKKQFDIKDIASLSHFVTREVVLEHQWYKKDAGFIMAYTEKGRKPVACIPRGRGKYIAYEDADKPGKVVDSKYAATLSAKADMVYRSFPEKPIKIWDLIGFGLKAAKKSDFVSYVVLALIGTLIGLILPTINQKIFDEFIPIGDKAGIMGLCALMLAITLGNLSFTIVKNLALFRGMNSMEYAVQNATYDKVFNLQEKFFREYDSADLAGRVWGITSIFQVCADVGINTVIAAVFSLTYLLRMRHYAKVLVKSSVWMVLGVCVVIGIVGYIQIRYEEKVLEVQATLSSKMYQFINGIAKVRIAGAENRVMLEYLKPYVEYQKIDRTKDRLDMVVTEVSAAANIFFYMVLYYVMVKKSASISMGEFMGFSTAFGSFSGAMLQMVSSFLQINSIIPTYKRCKPILMAMPEYDENAEKIRYLNGEIEVSNIDFSYTEGGDKVIDNLSLHINPGEYIGIVGPSGCGKSTLLKLLLGFEKPNCGRIYYDGKDIESLDKRGLRKKFGVVLQSGELIAGSIYENITITAPGLSTKKVMEVVESVGLKEDIAEMPMGLNTILSENCGTISGGQKQRILIARAIVNRPKVIFFDEATSALDNVTQAMVCDTLEGIKATKLVIAHRLSTVINCDRIIVLNNGKIEEQGTYQELMDKKGMFFDLASRQLA